jgi:hypothetical protein
VSSTFINSDFIYSVELKKAMERHQQQTARVIPVILRNCDWQNQPYGKLQALPKDGTAVTDSEAWSSKDKAFENIAKGIRAVVDNFAASHDNK